MERDKIIYLAIPYTWNPDVSFEIANEVAAKLMKKGNVVFSPISHSHPIAEKMNKGAKTDQKLWMSQDLPILRKCDKLVVVNIGEEGDTLIKNSKGCQMEIKVAKELNLEISNYYYHEPIGVYTVS